MNTIDKTKEARKQKRLEKLGGNNPVCIICGENNPHCLELHHIAGQVYGDELCTICRNCHRKLSDDQKDHPKTMGKTPTTYENIGHMLLGLADFFALLVEKLREFGQFLIQSTNTVVSR
jgi:hypothetical protein